MNKFYGIKKLKLSDLEETFGNPQEMEEKEFNGLVESIKEKGFILDDPVVWEYKQGRHRIISGHHRIKAAKIAGYEELNCKILINITEKQARLLVLESNKRRGHLDGTKFERYIQDILSDFEIDLDEVNKEIGILTEEIIDIDTDLQKESESLILTIKFKTIEEKEQFIDILDYYGGRGRSINDKIKQFVGIILRDQRKKEEKEKVIDNIII